MNKSLLKLGAFISAALLTVSTAFADKKAWSEVAAPEITKVEQTGPNEISVTFECLTSNDGADKGSVSMKSNKGASDSQTFGKTRKSTKKVSFNMTSSGTYTFQVTSERAGESSKKTSAAKTIDYVLPLTKTSVSARNIGGGKMSVSWTRVEEAEGYVVSYTDETGKTIKNDPVKTLNSVIDVKVGVKSTITVTAVRGKDSLSSDSIGKTSKAEEERIWKFTEFGTSTKPDYNRFEMLDSDEIKVKLYSCKYDPKTGNITDKGGKFESFFDGISFYYTKVDPKKENFELTATVTIDYHNPMADGQEGFGLLAIDRLGVDGEPMIIAYNNSAGLISRKFTTHVNGVKKEIKDGVGARFVSGITDEIIKQGDAGIKANAKSEGYAFSYDQSSDTVKTGDVYRVTLKKDNTGYHAIYKKEIESEGYKNTFTMYDNENVKLLQLDKNNIYVGFAVARGCNATFSDVIFNVTDPRTDPPAIPEPPTLVPLKTTIDCPSTWYDTKYPFVFTANCSGTITVTNSSNDKVLIKDTKITVPAGAELVDFKKTIKIDKGINDLIVTFKPEDGWIPAPKHAIAQWDPELLDYTINYKSVTYTHSVTSMQFKGEKNVLYVSPNGNGLGNGTKAEPLDLLTAIQYCQPGQTVTLLEGTYYPLKGVEIERGNDGTAKKRKVLQAEPGKRCVIDFSQAKVTVTAFNLFGNYWTIKNIDITRTPGDVKAIQVGGSYNEILMCDTYLNGDTGIQIAGRSAEPFSKWPSHNLIYGCESFGNSDPAQNNADGFASKLTSGEGNVFRNCVSHHNVDDGWDLYAKVETGPIGAVILDNCITYANGTKLDGTGKGDGNGFKMGGDGINVPHVLRNSISWGNGVNGVTCNSNPGLILDRVTVVGSGAYNVTLYGKGDAKEYPRTFVANGVLSIDGGSADSFDSSKDPELAGRLASDTNYFFNGSKAQNMSKSLLDKSAFVSSDTSIYQKGYKEDGKTFNRIPRDANGYFQLGNLFKLTDKVPAGVGADYNNTKANSNAK